MSLFHNENNVRFLCGDEDVWWDGAACGGGEARYVREDVKLGSVSALRDVVDNVVVSPSVSALVEEDLAAVQDVVGGFSAAAVGTFVTRAFAPPL